MHSSLLRVQWRTDAIFLVSILIVIIGCTDTEGAEWGEACDNGSNVCSAAKFLECDPQEKVCRCQGRPESRYDTYDLLCHKLDNSSCSTGGTMPCPFNGLCNLGEIPYRCACRPATPVTIRGDCAAAYGSTCTTSGTCDHNAYAQCINDNGKTTCKCDDTTSVYDSEGQQCLLKASQPCSEGTIDRPAQICVVGSACAADGDGSKCRCGEGLSENLEHLCRVNFGGTCTDDLKCDEVAFLICDDSSKCNCKPDLYDDGNGVCVTSFDKSCAAGEKCDSSLFLDCIDDKCKCRLDLIDVGSGDCKSLYGGACGNGEPDCDENNYLSCGSDFICHCKDGLTENVDGVCRAALGNTCGAGLPCDEKNFLHCDGEGKCVCDDGLQPIGGICTASIGGSCAWGEPCDTSKFLKCDVGATEKCVCRDGTVNNGQVCESLYDQPCGTGQPNCDATYFLECSNNNRCECPSDLVDQGNGDCRTNFEGSCAVGQPTCSDQQFLVCNSDEQCACKPGLEADANNVCLAGLDVSCALGETCDTSKFLVCDPDSNKCACNDDFSNVGGSCKGNFGTTCDTTIPCDDSKWLDCNAAANTCLCRPGTVDLSDDGNCQSLINEPCDGAEPICHEPHYLTCVSGSCKCKAEMVESVGECKSILDSSCDPDAGRPTCDDTNHLICEDDKLCHCEYPLESNSNGMCVLGFGEDCSNSLPCDETVFLECNSDANTCLCKSGTVDVGGGTCKSVFGESCGGAHQPECNPNDFLACDGTTCQCQAGLIEHDSVCYGKLNADCGDGKPECDAENSLECPEGGSKCQCKAELIANDEGLCRVIFGGECTIDGSEGKRCDESKFVVCKENLSGGLACSCDSDSWFHNNQQICAIKAGFSCQLVPEVGSQTCGENSHCVGTSDADAVCKCDGDLLPSVEGKCSLGAGQSCNPFQDQCDTAEWQFCDSGAFKCRCVHEEQVVQESCGRCRIRAEYPCEPDPTTMPCTTNAVCRDVSNRHFCVCDHGLLPNSVGKCTLTYTQDCGPPAPGSCDYEGFQTCISGKCGCIDLDNMYYDHHLEGKKCFLMVGKTCQVGSVVPCARHASCVGNTCACDTGYTPDEDGGCKSSVTLYSFWSQLPTYSNLFRRSS